MQLGTKGGRWWDNGGKILSGDLETMQEERRLWMCVIMQAIMETDPALVGLIDVPTHLRDKPKQYQQEVSAAAREWVGSDSFAELCHTVGMQVEVVRKWSPEGSKRGLLLLLDTQPARRRFVELLDIQEEKEDKLYADSGARATGHGRGEREAGDL